MASAQSPAPESLASEPSLSPMLLEALARLDNVSFNPPPLPIEDASISVRPAPEWDEASRDCNGFGEVLLPLQGGGLTHQDFAGLHLKLVAAVPIGTGGQQPFRLTLASPVTTEAIALTPSVQQLPGYLSLVPAEPYRLEANTTYRWTLAMPCESPQSRTVSGWIRKVNIPEAVGNIAAAPRLQQAQFYSHYGLWYDAVNAAMDLAQSGARSPLQALQN